MSKILSVLISLSITSCLAVGYFLNLSYVAEFAAYVVLSLSILSLFTLPFIGYYLQKFDSKEIVGKEVESTIKPMADKSFFMIAFNGVMSIAQIALLVAVGSTVIAVIYLIATVSVISLRVACKKRYKEWVANSE